MTTYINDTFTDTDAVPLTSHVGETGATWAQVTWDTNDADWMQIASNALLRKNGTSGTAQAYVSGAIDWDNDFTIRIGVTIVYANPNNAGILSLFGNGDNFGNGDYIAHFYFYEDQVTGPNFLNSDDGGSTDQWTFPFPTGTYDLRIERVGTTLKVYVDDDLKHTTNFDNIVTTALAGFLALQIYDKDGEQTVRVNSISVESGSSSAVEFWSHEVGAVQV